MPAVDLERAASSAFKLLAAHCTAGQIDHVRSNLPKDVQVLFDPA